MDFEFQGLAFAHEEVCKSLAFHGGWDDVLLDALRLRCLAEWAQQIAVTVTDEDVQEFADSYRAANDLYEAQEMAEFLRRTGLTEDDFAEYSYSQALRQAVREHLGDAETVHSYFMAHTGRFDRARISRIVVNDQELANELRMRIIEDGEDFHKLARKYSREEETRFSGGYVGLVRREDLEREASARVFASEQGAIVGPLVQDEQFHLILVEELLKAHLDKNIEEEIKDRLVAEWEISMLRGGNPG